MTSENGTSKTSMIGFYRLCVQKKLPFAFFNLDNFSIVSISSWSYCEEGILYEICLNELFSLIQFSL